MTIEEQRRRWEEEILDPTLEKFPERRTGFATSSGIPFPRVLSPEDVGELAKIPDKDTLRAQLAGRFMGPLQYLASSISGLVSHFASCVKARKEELDS